MKKCLLTLVGLLLIASSVSAQTWKEVFNTATGQSKSTTGQSTSISSLSNTDIVAALKQALELGARTTSTKLNKTNGFFGNSLIKLAVPPDATKLESTLRNFGLGSQVDKAVLAMNRAAEDACGKAAPIFADAIMKMNVQDGIDILKGGDGAATAYLRKTTTPALTSAFRPVIQNSLNKTGATALWSDAMRLYNGLPTTRVKINPDLAGYVTERALNGLFVGIADEESKIRKDPAARVTDLLSRVFGAK